MTTEHAGSSGPTAEAKALIVDPRYGTDHAFTAEADRIWRQSFEPAAGSVAESPGPSLGPSPALKARILDPRNDPRSRQFDRDFAAETDRLGMTGEAPPAVEHPSGQQLDGGAPGDFTGRVPEDISGYRLTSEKLASFRANMDGDDLFNSARAYAQRAGITDVQFNAFVGPVVELMSQRGAEAAEIDFTADIAALTPPQAMQLDAKGQRAAAGERIKAAINFVDAAAQQGLPRDVADFMLAQLADSHLGIKAIEWFRDIERGKA